MTDQSAQPAGLDISSRVIDGINVVRVRGEIDHNSAEQFHQALIAGHDQPSMRTVVDLSGVTFMDSTGLTALIATHRTTRESGGWIRLAAPTEAVLRVIRIVGLDTVIACYASLERAQSAEER
ncbi:STAS domain-containing protein [Streptomyces sp. NPDC005529]|uniref:STAS domain-containing protein n=1 Tax=unclassified Streptomyces TaxID=2593676 RepID=UPI0033BF3D28